MKVVVIDSYLQLSRVLSDNAYKIMSIDLETTSKRPSEAEIVGIAFCFDIFTGYYIPIAHAEGNNLDLKTVLKYLLSPLYQYIGQNIKYDMTVLGMYGHHVFNIVSDSMINQYILDPVEHKSLDALADKYLQHTTIKYKDVVPRGNTMADVAVDKAAEYAVEDVIVTYKVDRMLNKKVKEEGLEKLKEIEMNVLSVLRDMEVAGVRLDLPYLSQLSDAWNGLIKSLQEQMFKIAGYDININSYQQLAELFYNTWGLPRGKRTKTGWSTDNKELLRLKGQHEFIGLLLDYRVYKKMLSTYVDALPDLINPKTMRLHGQFNQCVTRTSRLSSSKPNLQNIPSRGDMGNAIRQAFIAEDHNVLVGADYSQIELRVFAHFSEDKALIKAFRDGGDVHTLTAQKIFSTPTPSKEERQKAKTVNFGILYGMSYKRLAKEINVSEEDAQDFLNAYFLSFPGVKKFIKSVVAKTKEKGYAETYLGHRRYLPSINDGNRYEKAGAERKAVSQVVQGTAADLIKLAMLAISENIFYKTGQKAFMILQVHDEIVLECPEYMASEVAKGVEECMTNALKLNVPIEATAKIGKTWKEIK